MGVVVWVMEWLTGRRRRGRPWCFLFVGGFCGCYGGFRLERVSVLRFVVAGLSGGVEVDDGVGIGAAVSSVEPTRAGKSDNLHTNTSQDDGTISRSQHTSNVWCR